MVTPNKPKDFDPAKFTIVGFCADCDYGLPVTSQYLKNPVQYSGDPTFLAYYCY